MKANKAIMKPISNPSSMSSNSSRGSSGSAKSPYKMKQFKLSNTMGLSIFHYVFMLLFILSFYYAVSGQDFRLSFSGLLNILSEAPTIPTDWISFVTDATIIGDWGIFNFLKEFLNSFVGIIAVLSYLCVGAVQIIVYLGYFLSMLFGM